jgi:hypothetical protein
MNEMGNPSPQQYGKWCRKTFLTHLEKEWAELVLREPWILEKGKRKILARVSKLNEKYYKYFYDVYQDDWQAWDSDSYLAFLMRDGEQLSYVLMNPKESKELLDKINPATDGSKKINIYMPRPGKLYIQKWPEFPFAARIIKLGPIIKSGFTLKPLSPEMQAALKNKSPEEIAELLEKI